MKTLQEIKNNYAQEQGYEDWDTFLNYYGGRHPEWFDQHMTEICIRAQKEALEKAANKEELSYEGFFVIRESITNPENLIR